MRISEPFAHELMENCLDYVDFLYQRQASLFSRFTRISDSENTFELSLEAMKETNGTKDGETNNKKEEKSLYQQLAEFIQKYRLTCKPAYTIDFDWGLSSGEENMLRIFSSLYHVFDQESGNDEKNRKKINKIYNSVSAVPNEKEGKNGKEGKDIGKTPCDTVLLFMDEADLTLHPEWQRRLIAILTAFIPQIYPTSCVKDIQLILSTHSPLILGDIPSENVTYLFAKNREEDDQKNKPRGENGQTNETQGKSGQNSRTQGKNGTQEEGAKPSVTVPGETFGQNIHTILKENFFLSEGTVGAFAAKKINDAAKRLNGIKNRAVIPSDDEMEALRRTVRLVAPGILRARLDKLLREAEAAISASKENAEAQERFWAAWGALSEEQRGSILTDLNRKQGPNS